MDAFLDWLDQRSYRWHIANILQITCILALIDSPALMRFVGATALGILALYGAVTARRAMTRIAAPVHAFDLMLLWLPGAVALALATGGLFLAVDGGLPWLGLPVFALHAALLVRLVTDQTEGRTLPNTATEAV